MKTWLLYDEFKKEATVSELEDVRYIVVATLHSFSAILFLLFIALSGLMLYIGALSGYTSNIILLVLAVLAKSAVFSVWLALGMWLLTKLADDKFCFNTSIAKKLHVFVNAEHGTQVVPEIRFSILIAMLIAVVWVISIPGAHLICTMLKRRIRDNATSTYYGIFSENN